MPIAEHPLLRSGRAELPHPAPTLSDNAEPHQRIRMANADRRNPSGNVALHPMPRQMTLTATGEHTPPQSGHGPGKREEGLRVHRHPVILDVPTDDRD